MILLLAAASAAIPTAARYECGRIVVVARYTKDRATLDWQGRQARLKEVDSADDILYVGRDRRQDIEFWINGSVGRFVVGRRTYACTMANPPLGAPR